MTYSIAPLQLRLIAFVLDYVVILGYIAILTGVSLMVANGPFQQQVIPLFANPITSDLVAFFTLVSPVISYFALQESSAKQATWGKRKVKIQVVTTDGKRLSRGRAFVRSGVKFLPWQLAHTALFNIEGWPIAPETPGPLVTVGLILVWVLVGAYFVSLVVSKRRRTPYDWLAGSVVIVETK